MDTFGSTLILKALILRHLQKALLPNVSAAGLRDGRIRECGCKKVSARNDGVAGRRFSANWG
jgi:hypothetical protein